MLPRNVGTKDLLEDLALIVAVCGTCSIALKWTSYFDHWVFYPMFPNTLDAAFLVFAIVTASMYIIHLRSELKRSEPS